MSDNISREEKAKEYLDDMVGDRDLIPGELDRETGGIFKHARDELTGHEIVKGEIGIGQDAPS